MHPADQLGAALELFSKLGIEIRRERLGGDGGGLCEVRGRRVLFLDIEADVATRLDRCLRGLATLAENEQVYIPPALREAMDRMP